ncbi:glutathione S-transferase family protein [Celerinatantimonas sp. MCCC 1A17872]|uniref:glutathione S-transferase family protein n=1 Tax=Celerinatantimonas sp. MCCC 1A17872 TaxID=3177514 RepID=UPI0038C3417C
MKLYETPSTPNCLRVSLFLAEKGMDIPREIIDVRAGDNLKEDFCKKSVNGLVPTLELDNGDYLCESIAICRYFEEIHPHPALFGQSHLERAQIEMWQRIIELQGIVLIAQAIRNLKQVYKDRENCIEDWGYEALLRFRKILPKIEAQLAAHQYIAGSSFSVADISTFIMLKMASKMEIEIDQQWPSIHRWQKEISQRPAFAALS